MASLVVDKVGEVDVSFSHFVNRAIKRPKEERLTKKGVPLRWSGGTACWIRSLPEKITEGPKAGKWKRRRLLAKVLVVCQPGDQYSREEGRKRALKAALQEMYQKMHEREKRKSEGSPSPATLQEGIKSPSE